ncbi:MAG: GDSL-type esterase/lipase family protein [Lentimicrobium sp.]
MILRILRKGIYLLILILVLYSCTSSTLNEYSGNDLAITRHGRTLVKDNAIELISSASYAEFQFKGDICNVMLSNKANEGDYNFAAIELDGNYLKRIKVENNNPQSFTFRPEKEADWHTLRIYKATEASNGLIVLHSVQAAEIQDVTKSQNLKIEFIGNSITCGMGNDAGEIPCGRNKWYDQHNAYWSYATITARSLNADFMLSSVSGAGIYRNWNIEGPTLPRLYESAYLHIDSLMKWDFSAWIPDVVVIALGTNDLSDGDGENPRLPFDSTAFIDVYAGFISTIYSHYPDARLVLLSSPMVTAAKSAMLSSCLDSVKNISALQFPNRNTIDVFEFDAVTASGCSGHPTIEEHKQMAEQLIPFMKSEKWKVKSEK